ncbi:LysR family transcriptional regulator [Pontibacter sp. BT310]|uniref:LysR family transcriptional regulator n=1 Tax=Pontibacter populi TaxID=890055 RepID=A0ABS6XF68_9BACT|nr:MULTISPECIES: LysR family transcriptional regulator [Pontibacter]MBJ6118986.1 LysR family transcriptional regulator [Pontibacter sp. BT310]MBR0571414.1 LysR family transcriptional regulator [Microvirga sp. STS03]MBW3365840.1 LysR family transcriptional regulator [Pontibacter populi]
MLSHKHVIFMEVARLLSFTKASQTLFISQSALSKQVKALEEYYKTGLFERLGNTIILTPAGKLLYEKLLKARQLQHELHDEFKKLNENFSPQVTMLLGASTTISLYILPPVLSAYLQQNPTINLTLRNRNSENILKALLDHELDLGIVEGISKVSNVTYTPFLTDDVIAVCSARNPLKKQQLEVKDLYDIPLALREHGSGTLAVLEDALKQKEFDLGKLPIRIRLGGTEALKNFVRVDTCLAFLPRQAVRKELQTGELVEVEIKDLKVKRSFNFIQRKGTESNFPYKGFIQFTKRYYSKQE